MSEKTHTPTVRKQKVQKSYIKVRLFVFLALAVGLFLVAIFAEQLCPYDPNAQDMAASLYILAVSSPLLALCLCDYL